MCFNSQSFGDLTIAEDFDTAIFHLFYFAAFYEAFWSNNSACFKCIQGRNIDGGESGFELCVAETTFWETTLDWGLATFKCWALTATGTCFLTLMALAGSLTEAGTNTAAFTLEAVLGAFSWL